MIAAALTIARLRSLFGVVIVASIYSFLMAVSLFVLDAADVSMTEAAVGAGISTVLLLGTLYLTKISEAPPMRLSIMPLAASIITGAILLYGVSGLPAFGDPKAPIHLHVGPDYIKGVVPNTGVPNAVTAVLASYRGFDTLGETTVIFTGGLGILLLLAGLRSERTRKRERRP